MPSGPRGFINPDRGSIQAERAERTPADGAMSERGDIHHGGHGGHEDLPGFPSPFDLLALRILRGQRNEELRLAVPWEDLARFVLGRVA